MHRGVRQFAEQQGQPGCDRDGAFRGAELGRNDDWVFRCSGDAGYGSERFISRPEAEEEWRLIGNATETWRPVARFAAGAFRIRHLAGARHPDDYTDLDTGDFADLREAL